MHQYEVNKRMRKASERAYAEQQWRYAQTVVEEKPRYPYYDGMHSSFYERDSRYRMRQAQNMYREKAQHKFKIMPFEVTVSESSFNMMTLNETVYLNALSGRVKRLSPEKIERMKSSLANEYGTHSAIFYCLHITIDTSEYYYMPIKLIKKSEMYPDEQFYRERIYRERLPERYHHPRYEHQEYPVYEYPRHENKMQSTMRDNRDYSESFSQEMALKQHYRQLPMPTHY